MLILLWQRSKAAAGEQQERAVRESDAVFLGQSTLIDDRTAGRWKQSLVNAIKQEKCGAGRMTNTRRGAVDWAHVLRSVLPGPNKRTLRREEARRGEERRRGGANEVRIGVQTKRAHKNSVSTPYDPRQEYAKMGRRAASNSSASPSFFASLRPNCQIRPKFGIWG